MISLLVFVVNLLILFFFVRVLKLYSTKYFSLPGVYYILSFLPVFTLLSYSSADFHSRPGYYDYLFALTCHTIFIGLGVFLSYIFLNKSKIPVRDFSIVFSSSDSFGSLNAWLLLFAVVLFFHQIYTLGDVPFFLVFMDVSVSDLTTAREEGYKLHAGYAVYFWHFSRMVFIPYLVCLSFVLYLQNRSNKSLILFVLLVMFGIVNNALSGAKAPVAMLFLCLFLIFISMKRGVRLRNLLLALVLIFSFPFFIEYSFSEKSLLDTFFHFTDKVFLRFSVETFDRTLSYFDLFPYELDYLGGRTNGLFTFFSGYDYFNVQNYVFLHRIDGYVSEHLIHGSANAHFIGYMNSDFGLVGVVLSCLIIGFIIGCFDVISSSRVNNSYTLSLYVVMSFIFWKLIGSQPTTVLFSHGSTLSLIMLIYFSKKR